MSRIKDVLIEFLGAVCDSAEEEELLQEAILNYDPPVATFEGELPTTIHQYAKYIHEVGLERIAENSQLLPPIGLGEMVEMLKKWPGRREMFWYTIVDDVTGEEHRVNINFCDGLRGESTAISFPDHVAMDSQQLAELGHLLVALSKGDYDQDSVHELIDGYEYKSLSPCI